MSRYETSNSEYGRWSSEQARRELDAYMAAEREFQEAFGRFDTDQSGFIELKELEVALQKARPNVPYDILRKVAELTMEKGDRNKDGKLSYEEFVAIHNNLMDLLQPEMKPGDTATAVGLVERPELNGSTVLLVAFNPSRQRWHCKLSGTGERMALKPENVQRIQSAAPAPSLATY